MDAPTASPPVTSHPTIDAKTTADLDHELAVSQFQLRRLERQMKDIEVSLKAKHEQKKKTERSDGGGGGVFADALTWRTVAPIVVVMFILNLSRMLNLYNLFQK